MPFYGRAKCGKGGVGEIILGLWRAVRRLTPPSAPVYSAIAMELKLYSREWCSWCMDAKDYLTEHGYKFTEIDVGLDRRAYEDMKALSEQTYVPTLVAGEDKVLANFDTDQLEEFLREHRIDP
jgi:glutaredoxin